MSRTHRYERATSFKHLYYYNNMRTSAVSDTPSTLLFVTVELTYRSSGRVRVIRDVCGDGRNSSDSWHGLDDRHCPNDGYGSDDVSRFLWFTGLADNRVETVNRVRRIVDGSHGTVGLYEAVLTSDHVASSLFRLVFDVARGGVVHAILVSIARRHLRQKNIIYVTGHWWLSGPDYIVFSGS